MADLHKLSTGNELATVEEVKAWLKDFPKNMSETDLAKTDAFIQMLIASAESQVRLYTGRTFTVGVTHTSRFCNFARSVRVYPDELVAITAVRDISGNPVQYLCPPKTGEHIPWVLLEKEYRNGLTIEGDWGWVAVPADIKQAVVTTVAIWWRREISGIVQGLSVDTGFIERPKALPQQVMGMLEPYVMTGGF